MSTQTTTGYETTTTGNNNWLRDNNWPSAGAFERTTARTPLFLKTSRYLLMCMRSVWLNSEAANSGEGENKQGCFLWHANNAATDFAWEMTAFGA